MAEVGNLEIKVLADIADVKSKLDQVIQQLNQTGIATNNLTKSVFSGVAAWDLLKKGVSEIVGFMKGSLDAFAKDEVAVVKLQSASQKAGIEWSQMAKVMNTEVARALKETTFANEDVVSSLARLTTAGITGAKATDALRAAQDAASARGLDLETVVAAIARGSQGYARGLIQLGLNVKNVTDAQDKEGEIVRQLTALYGGAALASANTYSGQIQRLKNNFDEVRVTIASQVIPVLNDAIKGMLGFTGQVNDNVQAQTKLQSVIYRVVEGLKFIGDTAVEAFNILKGAIMVVLTPLIATYAVLEGIFKAIKEHSFKAFTDNLKNMNSAVASVFKDIGGEIAKTSDAGTQAWKGMTEGAGFDFKEMGDNMTDIIKGTATEITDEMDDALDKLASKIHDFSKNLSGLVDKHKDAVDQMEQDIKDLTTTYEEESAKRKETFDTSVADVIKSHQDKVEQLKKQLAEETAFGKDIDEVKIAQTRDELAKEQSFLNKHASDAAAVSEELGEDEIDRLKKNLKEETETVEKEYNKRLSDLKSALAKEQKDYDNSLAELGVSFRDKFTDIRDYILRVGSPEIIAAFRQMITLANVELQKLNLPLLPTLTATSTAPTSTAPTTTTPSVKQIITIPSGATLAGLAKQYGTTLANILAVNPQVTNPNLIYSGAKLNIPSFQRGGVVPETGIALVHKGETILPKSVSPVFNVNFYGDMSFNTKKEEDDFINKIRKVLMRDFETARMGIY